MNHRSLVKTSLLAANIVLSAISVQFFLVDCAVSAISFIPLFRWFEGRADDFALKNYSIAVIKEFTLDLAEGYDRVRHIGLSGMASFFRYLSSCEERLAKCQKMIAEKPELNAAV